MVTQNRLKEVLSYEVITGNFYWKIRLSSTAKLDQIAGTINSCGYRIIKIDGTLYTASRLAFLFMLGYIPAEVDHINNTPLDNSWLNLRAVTKNQNQHNKKLQINNTSGIKGVTWHKKVAKWQAQVKLQGKYYSAGYFNCLIEAKEAVETLRLSLHGEYTNHG